MVGFRAASTVDHQHRNYTMWKKKGDQTVIRKLVFIERELEKLSEIVDDLVDDEWLYEDDARDIRDCIINMELQVADLQELADGPQVAK